MRILAPPPGAKACLGWLDFDEEADLPEGVDIYHHAVSLTPRHALDELRSYLLDLRDGGYSFAEMHQSWMRTTANMAYADEASLRAVIDYLLACIEESESKTAVGAR